MYYGLPIIGSVRAGSRYVVRYNGFLIDPFCPEELEAALRTFADSRELCLSMGRRSREIVREYTIDFTAGQLKALLNKGE